MAFARAFLLAFATISSLCLHSVLATVLEDASIRQQACRIGVCLAIDGSSSISEREFSRQRFLARRIILEIPTTIPSKFAAVQYGAANQAISELTDDRELIKEELLNTEQIVSNTTFLAAGLNFCFSELIDIVNDRPVCRRSFIVVMGSGNGDIGTDPAERARLFESVVRRSDVLAVRFGTGANVTELMEISGPGDFFDARNSSIRNLGTRIVERSFRV